MNKLTLKQRHHQSNILIKDLMKQGHTIEQCRTLLGRTWHISMDIIKGKREMPTIQKTIRQPEELKGMTQYIEDVELLMKNGSKGIFICGYHGLGKSSVVNVLAKKNKADLVRVQITEMTSEFDLVGSPDPKTGKFINSPFVEKLIEAQDNKDKEYYLLLDEFTRGRDEALNILYPVLAEKKLFINSPYSEVKEIEVPKNMKVFATGNLHDSGQREVGQAESDRYNIIEIDFIKDKHILNSILGKTILEESLKTALVDFYLGSIENYEQSRILAMSIRTMIEAGNIMQGLIDNGQSSMGKSAIFKKAIHLTYYGTSQSMLNPNYKMTYNEMVKTATRRL